MAYYLVKIDDKTYANGELYYTAIAGGERAFMKMLANKSVKSIKLLDQDFFLVTEEQEDTCRREYSVSSLDFTDWFKNLNIMSKDSIDAVKKGTSAAFPGATVITVDARFMPKLYKYRQVNFFRAMDYKESGKYRMLHKMAHIKICGRMYIALNTVDVRIDKPILVTLKKE